MDTMSLSTVLAEAHISRGTLNNWIAAGTFPKPIKLSERKRVWVRAEIEAWKEAQKAKRDAEAV